MTKRSIGERRRTGCWTCKDKHVQCTEETPTCYRCMRLNLGCEYGIRLLWKEDAAQRGISLGREGKWWKNSKAKSKQCGVFQPVDLGAYIGNWIFLNTTWHDFEKITTENKDPVSPDLSELEDEGSLEILPSVSSNREISDSTPVETSLILWRPGLSTPLQQYSSIEGNLFDYFVAVICPNCSLSSSLNPYLTLLTPMSFTFAPLNSALLAVSANQLRLLNDKRFEHEAWSYKNKAIRGVQKAIYSGTVDAGVVATVLMLCFYDISDGCNSSWVTHLRGGLSLLNELSKSRRSEDSLHAFLRMYFVAHAIMSRTAYEDDIPLAEELYNWPPSDELDEIDVLMGCSRSLMNIIQKIPVLATQAEKLLGNRAIPSSSVSKLSSMRDTIERSLESLHQTLPAGANNSSELVRIAETKRLTALLYLRSRLSFLVPTSYSFPSVAFNTSLIASIIDLISQLPNSPTLLWPLFVLGNTPSGLNEEQRRFVHERLMALQRVRNLGSVRRARLCVEEVWRRKDLEINDGDGDRGSGIRLGSGSAISLA